MQSITVLFRQVSAGLMVLSYTVEEISKIFHILSSFAKSASPDYFEDPKQHHKKKSFKEIPLYFSEKGENALKEKLLGFPHVLETGKSNYRESNFLYLVGQFLSVVAIKLDYLELQEKEIYKKYEEDIKKLFTIWGSREKMNALGLFNSFESINNEAACKKLEKKLSDSTEIIDKIKI